MKIRWYCMRASLVLFAGTCMVFTASKYARWTRLSYSENPSRDDRQLIMEEQREIRGSQSEVGSRKFQSLGKMTALVQKKYRHLPEALIVGVAKSGTATFETFLAHHPLVQGMRGAEVCFFKLNHLYQKGVEHYRSMMPPSPNGTIQIERSSNYFQDDAVPSRVFGFDNSMKIIFIFKEPASRVLSQYVHNIARNVTPERDHTFEQLVFKDSVTWAINPRYNAVDISLYDKHLAKWLMYFPQSQMLFIDGEEFIRNPFPQIKQAERFLNLRSFFVQEQFVLDQQKGFFCFKQDGDGLVCMGKDKGRKHPNVSTTVMKRLESFYVPHNEKLVRLTGKQFSWIR